MIKFYKLKDEYGCFSNFSKHPIYVDDKLYPTTEFYYQSKKFLDPKTQEMIRTLTTSRECADVARKTPNLRPDWEEVKYEIMKDALRFKIQQHTDVFKKLMETGNEEIAEDTKDDYIWGIGSDGTGKNLLGKAWMDLRREYQNK